MKIAPSRIGSGALAFACGFLALGVGVFAGLGGASAGEPGLSAFGSFLVAVGCGLIAVGFWISLFHKIELRMIDMQKMYRKRDGSSAGEAPEAQPPVDDEDAPASPAPSAQGLAVPIGRPPRRQP